MRDWNNLQQVQEDHQIIYIVEPYLWEIETFLCSVMTLTLYVVEPYLWEIETGRVSGSYLPAIRWTVPMRDWNKTASLMHCVNFNMLNRTYERLKLSIQHFLPCFSLLSCWIVPMSEQCALYTVINVDEKERKPEQLMSVRQIWIVQVFYFSVVFMHCVLIVKICRYGNRFGDGKCYDRYIKRAWIKIFTVWAFSDSEQIL